MGVADNASVIVETHAPRVGHSRRTEPPTKGWQLAREAPTWTCTMPVWATPIGACQLCHWRQDIMRRGQQGQFKTGVSRLSEKPGARWDQQVSYREKVGFREVEYCTALAKQVTAWAEREEVELRDTKRHLLIKRLEKNTLLLGELKWTKQMEKNRV